ncbi:HAD-IIB family hydrolase [Lutimaribacter marinistellae]|uniref:HAD-IIB family hydrolase n=1 Tax=Lutimaribacter marinistellae TaxID=1820329 RepID=A0ABV7TD22_9RHOB
MVPPLSLLVFSDLDGTLLDHRDYSWDAARPGLDALRQMGAGLVLASSKTAAEIAPLRAAMGASDWPAIVENGAGILWPGDAAGNDRDQYDRLRAVLHDAPREFTGFGDMTAEQISRHTGLPVEAATRAANRQFSEPGLWTGSEADLDAFLNAIARQGIHARRGGRFLTLSFGRTKADAMAEVTARLRPARTIALGDAPNDVEMIEAADRGVIIRNPDAPPIPPLPGEAQGTIHRTTRSGPAGWSDAITRLVDEISRH